MHPAYQACCPPSELRTFSEPVTVVKADLTDQEVGPDGPSLYLGEVSTSCRTHFGSGQRGLTSGCGSEGHRDTWGPRE